MKRSQQQKNGPVRKPVDGQEVLQGEDRHPSVVVEVGQGVVELLGPGGQVVGRGLAGVRDRLVLLIGSEIMNQILSTFVWTRHVWIDNTSSFNQWSSF